MKKLGILLCLLSSGLWLAAADKSFIDARVSKTETIQVKTQTRVIRIEIFAEDPEAVVMVSHHVSEQLADGRALPIGGWQRVSRDLKSSADDEVTVDKITITRAQFIALAAAFAEADLERANTPENP